MDIPDWIPADAQHSSFLTFLRMRQNANSNKRITWGDLDPANVEEMRTYDKLLSKEMKSVWGSLSKRNPEKGWIDRFTWAVIVATRGPKRFERLTKANFRQKAEKAQALATDLANLLNEMGISVLFLDLLDQDAVNEIVRKFDTVQLDGPHCFRNQTLKHLPPRKRVTAILGIDKGTSIIDLLRNLPAQIEGVARLPRVLKKPGDESARTYYFVRHLTDYFVGEFGKPLRATVAQTANCILDLDEHQVLSESKVCSDCLPTSRPARSMWWWFTRSTG